MANTKITSGVIADNSVGITQLNVSDGSSGQFLKTDGSGTLSFATVNTTIALDDIATGDAASTLATSSGDITLDSPADINLDADGEQIRFKDGGTEIGHVDMGSQNLTIRSKVDNKDIEFHGTDGGANIVALKLDMSEGGRATFNRGITCDGGLSVFKSTGGGTELPLKVTDASDNMVFEVQGGGRAHFNYGPVLIGSTTDVMHANFDDLQVGHTSGSKGMTIVSGNDSYGTVAFADGSSGNQAYRGFIEYYHAEDSLRIGTGGAEKFRITEQGTIGMGPGSGNLAGSIIINNDGATGTLNNAYYNTVLGWEAADDLTSGDSNTIVGNQAGYKLTEATGCTLIGRLAGETLTTGSYNTAIGFNTMGDGVVTGSSNTAVGNSVMVAVTSGAGNTALGEACAAALTTGSNNVSIGRSAMSNGAVTGNYNIAIGYEALRAVTSGYENICMGRDAGHDITSAQQNVAIGHESMTKNVSATANVCVGFQAGENVTGGGNTMIGYKAGEATEGGVYNVFIGENTKGTHPSHSQQIAIGRNIDAAPGQVAIGTSGLGKVYNEFDTDNAWSQGSDERLKQDIKDSTLGLDFINDLRPVTYRWKPSNELPKTFPMYDEENQKNTDIVMTGLIAQEVKTAIETSGVERFGGWGEDNDGIQQIRKELFVFPLINAVKELTAKLEAAEARIAELENG